ncbi:DUF1627 domain-containing protein [Salmonella enterica]|nr:DUF1627 domain-containing protein [Salmonella enterica]
MKSESVIDALKAMDKATSREVAARLAIDHVDTLVMLQDEMERGTVECKNGRWSVVSAEESESGNTATVTASDTSGNGDKAQGKISEQQMIDVIRKHGQQTAEELATLFGITVRKVASTLAMATSKGRLNRVNQGGAPIKLSSMFMMQWEYKKYRHASWRTGRHNDVLPGR